MGGHSGTAIMVAVGRRMHTEMVEQPLLDDELAADLYTDEEKERMTDTVLKMALTEDQRNGAGDSRSFEEEWETCFRHAALAASTVVRNKYAEDRLERAVRNGLDQYVVVGAGFDTFSWRRTDMAADLAVFELDHPDTQQLKRDRLDAAGLSVPETLHFVPVDLEDEPVASALAGTAYDADRPAFYSWLGVTPYLASEAIYGTLRSIAERSASGSELVFDFLDTEGSDPETTTPGLRRVIRMVEQMGEPYGDGLRLGEIEDELEQLGFEVVELLGPDDQRRRYFDDQPDYFDSTEHYHFAHVRVA